VNVVIKKYIKLVGKESSADEFACKLAREAYFRTDVIGKAPAMVGVTSQS
jgi:hypothetical protein